MLPYLIRFFYPIRSEWIQAILQWQFCKIKYIWQHHQALKVRVSHNGLLCVCQMLFHQTCQKQRLLVYWAPHQEALYKCDEICNNYTIGFVLEPTMDSKNNSNGRWVAVQWNSLVSLLLIWLRFECRSCGRRCVFVSGTNWNYRCSTLINFSAITLVGNDNDSHDKMRLDWVLWLILCLLLNHHAMSI